MLTLSRMNEIRFGVSTADFGVFKRGQRIADSHPAYDTLVAAGAIEAKEEPEKPKRKRRKKKAEDADAEQPEAETPED